MEQRMKSMSLRQFRERAAEIFEPIEIVLRDRDGNFRVLGYYTPYATYPPGAVELPKNTTGKLPEVSVSVLRDGETVALPSVRSGVIKTPAEAAAATAAAVGSVRSFPKSAQLGRKKS
jgi:hypothetical protein